MATETAFRNLQGDGSGQSVSSDQSDRSRGRTAESSPQMTVREIERACDENRILDFKRHALAAPLLTLRETFYPFGFPTEVRTNSEEILAQARRLWSVFEARFDTQPILVDVHVIEDARGKSSFELPPAPGFRMMLPLLVNLADGDNYSIVNLDEAKTQMTVTQTTVSHASYLNYFFLGAAPLSHIATRFTMPVHAGCVSLEGRGVLLCGDSGAGKSTLSYACARAGWSYTSDDAIFLVNEDDGRTAIGNCHQIRFRPSAASLFPEIDGLEITPRATGKPSIELPTACVTGMVCSQTVRIDFLVFLNRQTAGLPELRPYRSDVARGFLRQVLFGSEKSLQIQYATAERLLTAEVFELRYSDLDWAVNRLQRLVREGR